MSPDIPQNRQPGRQNGRRDDVRHDPGTSRQPGDIPTGLDGNMKPDMQQRDLQQVSGVVFDTRPDDRGNLMIAAVVVTGALVALALNTN
jgi:hypothetical protein